jgi:hypothetical protein
MTVDEYGWILRFAQNDNLGGLGCIRVHPFDPW